MVETVGAGARKSVCFCDLCRWSVGCHQRLRSRWTYFPPVRVALASVESRIALSGEKVQSQFGVPNGGSSGEKRITLIQLSVPSDGAALAAIKVKDERARTIFKNLIACISRFEIAVFPEDSDPSAKKFRGF